MNLSKYYSRYEVAQERNQESRVWALGRTATGRYLTVVYTIRAFRIRAITAHTTKKKYRSFYEESVEGTG